MKIKLGDYQIVYSRFDCRHKWIFKMPHRLMNRRNLEAKKGNLQFVQFFLYRDHRQPLTRPQITFAMRIKYTTLLTHEGLLSALPILHI